MVTECLGGGGGGGCKACEVLLLAAPLGACVAAVASCGACTYLPNYCTGPAAFISSFLLQRALIM